MKARRVRILLAGLAGGLVLLALWWRLAGPHGTPVAPEVLADPSLFNPQVYLLD